MTDIRTELSNYGTRIVRAGLSAGAGGNISARDGDVVWMKPSGFAMDELTPDNLCGLILATGEQSSGEAAPTTEFNMHLAVYRARPDVTAVFHTHPPWMTGIISAGVPFQHLTTEGIGYLGRVIHLPYEVPQSDTLAVQVGEASRNHETMLLPNHGIVTVGASLREAYHRSLVAEDTAKSVIAASLVGKPQFLSDQQISEILNGETG
jgi:L-fuculose-phosphate aldolase